MCIRDSKVLITENETTASKVQQKTMLKKAIEAVIEALDTGHLGKYQITIRVKKGDPVVFHLDTNLINIPMAEAERLDGKLLDKEDVYKRHVIFGLFPKESLINGQMRYQG